MREPTDEGRRRRYAGEILHNDALLPRLLEKLSALGLAEDTLLIFLADHGEYMGEHGLWGHKPPGLMPVIHVPLMMVYPKRFQEAKRIGDPVQLIDVMPTILELAEVDPADLLLQGNSLIGLIEGRDPERWRESRGDFRRAHRNAQTGPLPLRVAGLPRLACEQLDGGRTPGSFGLGDSFRA